MHFLFYFGMSCLTSSPPVCLPSPNVLHLCLVIQCIDVVCSFPSVPDRLVSFLSEFQRYLSLDFFWILSFCPVILYFLVSDFWTELNDLRTLHPCVLSLGLCLIISTLIRSGKPFSVYSLLLPYILVTKQSHFCL